MPLALAGPSQQQAISRMFCSVAVSGVQLLFYRPVPDLSRKTRQGKKWQCTHCFSPGWLARRERHRRSTCCCTERLSSWTTSR